MFPFFGNFFLFSYFWDTSPVFLSVIIGGINGQATKWYNSKLRNNVWGIKGITSELEVFILKYSIHPHCFKTLNPFAVPWDLFIWPPQRHGLQPNKQLKFSVYPFCFNFLIWSNYVFTKCMINPEWILELLTRILMKIVQNQAKIFFRKFIKMVKVIFHLCDIH